MSAAPRPAATVAVLRPGPAGPEVLMVRRHRGASFMADAYVFPGGRVEPEDGDGEAAFACAAARELREEAALSLEPAGLVPLARWITPSAEGKRFDARFFVAAAREGQTACHDAVETTAHLWARPVELLARGARGELKLPPPTLRTLEELSPQPTVEAALAWAQARPVVAILPKLVTLDDKVTIVLPWDPDYDRLPGEGLAVEPTHPLWRTASRLCLHQGRWWGQRPG